MQHHLRDHTRNARVVMIYRARQANPSKLQVSGLLLAAPLPPSHGPLCLQLPTTTPLNVVLLDLSAITSQQSHAVNQKKQRLQSRGWSDYACSTFPQLIRSPAHGVDDIGEYDV